jgi:hypothetical protein
MKKVQLKLSLYQIVENVSLWISEFDSIVDFSSVFMPVRPRPGTNPTLWGNTNREKVENRSPEIEFQNQKGHVFFNLLCIINLFSEKIHFTVPVNSSFFVVVGGEKTSHKTQDLQELQANKVVIVTRDLKRSVIDMKTMDVDAS